MAAQSNAALPDGSELDGYRIVKKISSGGFSIVYLAADASGQSVVIKEFLPVSLAQRRPGERVPRVSEQHLSTYRLGLKCFFEEGRALAMICHPNVVRVLNFFRANGTVYMVMDYESGRTLYEHMALGRSRNRKDVLSEQFIRRVFAQVLTGLWEVHANRILHLDVKPANIFLRLDGTPILLDFGAARRALQSSFSNSLPMYTPGYAAPELYRRDAELGPWTDVYGVGAALYACMAGKAPPAADVRLAKDEMAALLHGFRGLYSPRLLALADRCLRLNSLERPQSIAVVQKEMAIVDPEQPKSGLLAHAAARVRRAQSRVVSFMRAQDISWF
jgi:eukaryotic-like serine/threonine-protein kinase